MSPRVLQLITSCEKCPHNHYYIAGVHTCALTDALISDKHHVAAFCPLPVYPSQVIVGLSATVQALRTPYTLTLQHSILSHIATKLKCALNSSGHLSIPLRDGGVVEIGWDYITAVGTNPGNEVTFVYGADTYLLTPDSRPPQLRKQRIVEGFAEPLWVDVPLSISH